MARGDHPIFQELLQKARSARAGEPCWCGSLQLFEDCHRDRERQPRKPLLQAAITRVEAAMGKHRRACLHFEAPAGCSADFIRSHTIQRAALERIADGSHVLGFVPSLPELLRGRHLPQRLGLKEASTMTAFCGKHDRLLFAPLEKRPYSEAQDQVFLLAYRTVCREIFANEWRVERLLPMMREMDRGLTLEEQVALQTQVAVEQFGAIAAGTLFEDVKEGLDSRLRTGNLSGLRLTAIEFPQTLPLASCSARVPTGDFGGKARDGLDFAQDLVPISFSLIPNVESGIAVLVWLGHSPANEQFVASLMALEKDDLGEAVVRFAFTYAENTFMSPRWWAGLSNNTVDTLTARMRAKPVATSLLQDGIRVARWPVSRRFSGTTWEGRVVRPAAAFLACRRPRPRP